MLPHGSGFLWLLLSSKYGRLLHTSTINACLIYGRKFVWRGRANSCNCLKHIYRELNMLTEWHVNLNLGQHDVI
jgi:hypothetical protein